MLFPVGHEVSADEFSSIDGVWTSYTPTWLCVTGTNPVLGNGILTGRWRYANPSESHLQIIVEISLTAGTTTTYGTGVWIFGLPFNQSASGRAVGSVSLTDSGSTIRPGVAQSGSGVGNVQLISPTGQVTALVPQTWAVNDNVQIWMSYEQA